MTKLGVILGMNVVKRKNKFTKSFPIRKLHNKKKGTQTKRAISHQIDSVIHLNITCYFLALIGLGRKKRDSNGGGVLAKLTLNDRG